MGGFSVEGTIIAGMMISQLGGVFLQYYQIKLQEDETGLLELYQMLVGGDILYQDMASMIIFLVACTITLVPMILIRYRFNAVAFDDMEVRAMGINNGHLRMVGLILGSLMATVALIHCGDVGFLCMVIIINYTAIGFAVPAGVITTLVLLPLFVITIVRRGSVFA